MKGCVVRLALLPTIVAILYVLLSIRAPFPTLVFQPEAGGAHAAAPIAGFFFWFATLYLLDARRARTDFAAALEALGRGLRDGERAVVYGTVEARGSLLEAPFSGESCVGYHYVVDHRDPSMRGRQTDYEGFALAPMAIRGPMGALAVLAPSDKELFYEIPFEHPQDDDSFAHAESYLRATDFGKPGGRLGNLSRRETTDGPGTFRLDESSGTQNELRACTLKQKVLRPGHEVSVAGVYSEARRAIEPDPDGIMRPLHVVPGGEAALASKIRSKRRGAAVCAVLGLVVVAVYVFAFLPRAS